VCIQQKLFRSNSRERFTLVNHRDKLRNKTRHKLHSKLGKIFPKISNVIIPKMAEGNNSKSYRLTKNDNESKTLKKEEKYFLRKINKTTRLEKKFRWRGGGY